MQQQIHENGKQELSSYQKIYNGTVSDNSLKCRLPWYLHGRPIPKNNTVEEYRGRAIVNVPRIVQRYSFAAVQFSI